MIWNGNSSPINETDILRKLRFCLLFLKEITNAHQALVMLVILIHYIKNNVTVILWNVIAILHNCFLL